MNTKEKAPTREANTGGGGAGTVVGHSCNYSTTSAQARQQVFPLLGYGKQNAVPGHKLAGMLGLDDLRELTRLVERERASGVPICATCDSQQPGYYLAMEPSELAAYIKSLDRRLHNTRRTRERLADTLAGMTGQRRLF